MVSFTLSTGVARVIPGDTCNGIVSKYNNTFTTVDLYAWNRDQVSDRCNIWATETLCVGVEGYKYTGPLEGGDIYTPAMNPMPIQNETTDGCTKDEYTLGWTPLFRDLLAQNNITEDTWNALNWPGHGGPVWDGYFSCVAGDMF